MAASERVLAVLFSSAPCRTFPKEERRLYCNGTYYEGQQWIVEASLRPLEAAQSLCCDGADGAGGAGVPGPKDEATGLQSEGRSLTLLGGIFSERVTFQSWVPQLQGKSET